MNPSTPTLPEAQKRALIKEMNSIRWWHHIPLPPLGPGVVTPGTEPTPEMRMEYLHLPESFAGQNVLDIGAWDGKFSFLAEARGAKYVVAADVWEDSGSSSHTGLRPNLTGLQFAHSVLESHVRIERESVYNLDQILAYASMDTVLFFGVLYHLVHPMLALKQIARVLKPGGLLILETATAYLHMHEPVWQFAPDGWDGDETNVWYPNRSAMEGALRKAGFCAIQHVGGTGGGERGRDCWHARRKA
jgi:tRNA (mo5U34)-methyltransferase